MLRHGFHINLKKPFSHRLPLFQSKLIVEQGDSELLSLRSRWAIDIWDIIYLVRYHRFITNEEDKTSHYTDYELPVTQQSINKSNNHSR